MQDTLNKLSEELIELYSKNSDTIRKDSPEILNAYRPKAFDTFKKLGLPTKKNESYKYTNLESYFKGKYTPVLSPEKYSVNLSDIFKCDVPELDTHVVLILNGFYYHLNEFPDLPEGVTISSLSEGARKHPDIFEKHYGKYAETDTESLAALNTLFTQDGVFIHVDKNTVPDKPIQIINLCYSNRNLRVNNRNLIVTEKSAKVKIVVCDHTLTHRGYLTNSVTETYAAENSIVDYTRVQNENSKSTQLSNIFVHQEKNSKVTSNAISLHGGLIRNNVYVTLNGAGCDNHTAGLFLCDDHQHIASYTEIRHLKPHCTSNQLFKGILDDEATGAFNGKIYVAKDAQKTMAYQRNNNILLSKNARMNSKPQLEIYADDVKCSHGATAGQLDNEAMFYIQTRGIGKHEARLLLMYAFANEIIEHITIDPLKERITDLVEKRLRGELSRCNNCNVKCG